MPEPDGGQKDNPTGVSSRLPHLWMMVFAVIVAGSFPVASAITPGMDSVVLTFWRFLAATAIFAVMLPFVKGNKIPAPRDLWRYLGVGFSYGLFFILMFESLKTTTALNTGTIYTLLPLLTMIFGAVLGEPVRLRQMVVLALSMAATLWVIFRGNLTLFLELRMSRGDLLFFLGTVCLAFYMLAMKRLQGSEPRICFTFYSLTSATLLLLGASLWRTGGSLPLPGTGIWLGIAYLAGPSTAGTFWILQYTAPRLGPNRVAAYTFLNPSAVACLQWGLGLSPPDPVVLPGISLTLAAVWLLQLDRISGHT
ncbi:MAG: DMT family transporter [Pseudomonadota bacterium]